MPLICIFTDKFIPMKIFKSFFPILLFCGLYLNQAYALEGAESTTASSEAGAFKTAIENRQFVFQAQTAHPLAWRSVNLDYGFHLKVSPDTIEAYLPYYGRAYKAPLGPDESGVKFTSYDFDYQIKEGKSGRLDITIKPKDLAGKSYVLYLSAFPGGNCSLSVQDPDRQHIHFNGILEFPE